jgi:hypothetical protein
MKGTAFAEGALMRSALLPLSLAVIAPVVAVACSSAPGGGTTGQTTSAWACAQTLVPNGVAVSCTATSSSALTTETYTCGGGGTTGGGTPCPPPDVDAGPPPTCGELLPCGPGDDAGTTTPPPSDDGGAPVGQGGGYYDSGASGGDYDASGSGPGNSNGGGNGKGGGGGKPGSSSGSSSGSTGASSGGVSSSGGGTGSDDGGCGSEGPTPEWQCSGDGNYVTCNQPPSCAPGSHASACGACVPDGTCDDCVPPSAGGCWVTGGGFIDDDGGQDSFGGNAMPMKSGTIRGEWEDVDHATGDKAHGQAQYIYCRHVNEPGPGQPSGPSHNFDINQVYFGGPARWFTNGTWADGYWFDVMAEDHGEGKGAKAGGPDYYHFTIRQISGSGVSGAVIYDTENDMGGGNIQIHPPNGGHPYAGSSLPPWVSLQP